MKKDTHPEYHVIDVKMTNGDVVQRLQTKQDAATPLLGESLLGNLLAT